jgi:hypothetical protein
MVDPLTGEIRKKVHSIYPNNSGAVTTAGGLVFTGFTDGTLAAYDGSRGLGARGRPPRRGGKSSCVARLIRVADADISVFDPRPSRFATTSLVKKLMPVAG